MWACMETMLEVVRCYGSGRPSRHALHLSGIGAQGLRHGPSLRRLFVR